MRILGVRVSPKVSSFIVYCTKSKKLVCSDVITVPATLDTPEKLKYMRNNMMDILRFYEVDVAAIRATETNSQNQNIDRLYIEAVIQEAFSSSEINKYYIIRKQGIKAALNLNNNEYNEIINSEKSLYGIDNASFSSETNEALLVALSAELKL